MAYMYIHLFIGNVEFHSNLSSSLHNKTNTTIALAAAYRDIFRLTKNYMSYTGLDESYYTWIRANGTLLRCNHGTLQGQEVLYASDVCEASCFVVRRIIALTHEQRRPNSQPFLNDIPVRKAGATQYLTILPS